MCRLVRLRALLAGVPWPSAEFSRHVQGCESCRSWLAAQAALEQQLTRESRQKSGRPAPDGLDQFIMAGVRRHQSAIREGARGASSPIRLISIGGALAAAALAAFVLFLWQPAPQVDSGDMVAASEFLKPEEVEAMVATVEALPVKLRNTFAPPAARLAQANPLIAEIDSVYSDAQAALDFLAMNFLPTGGNGESDAETQDLQG
ncbi:MAG TPA: hypothetical protein VGA56_17455 [Opitutaceae bacterium]